MSLIARFFIQKTLFFPSDIRGRAMLGRLTCTELDQNYTLSKARCAVQGVTRYSPVAHCTPKFFLCFRKYSVVESVPAPCEFKHHDLYLYYKGQLLKYFHLLN